jgi:1,4-alpha-glucan branching enzyme
VPEEGYYEEIFNSDSEYYYGSNVGNGGGKTSENHTAQGRSNSIVVNLPPLAGLYFKLKK